MTAEEWIAALQADPKLAEQLDDLTRKVSERDLKQRRMGAKTAVAQLCVRLRDQAHNLGPGEKGLWLRNIIDVLHKEGKYLDKVIAKWKPE